MLDLSNIFVRARRISERREGPSAAMRPAPAVSPSRQTDPDGRDGGILAACGARNGAPGLACALSDVHITAQILELGAQTGGFPPTYPQPATTRWLQTSGALRSSRPSGLEKVPAHRVRFRRVARANISRERAALRSSPGRLRWSAGSRVGSVSISVPCSTTFMSACSSRAEGRGRRATDCQV